MIIQEEGSWGSHTERVSTLLLQENDMSRRAIWRDGGELLAGITCSHRGPLFLNHTG